MDINGLARAFDGRRVLVTGHTGFKGSWLSLWLTRLGATVGGLALPPETQPHHFGLLDLPMESLLDDIRQPEPVADAFARLRPEVVFHLAAQPLVRRSYREPVATFAANVMGTVHVLEACRACPDTRAVVVVTSDKCYANREWPWGYREIDPLGGHDPYSASKAAAELAAASYRATFFENGGPLVATARGGNVIGGGDWSEDRLLPDLVRAMATGASLEIRSPAARRPWQHVLDCLHGYLLLAAGLAAGDRRLADAWNFGPDPSANATVSEVLEKAAAHWPALRWHTTTTPQPHEATSLYIDSAKARAVLGWRPVWDLDAALGRTITWYRDFLTTGQVSSAAQVEAFAAAAGAPS
ncbi:CDP-glucose 4,6-dehydratase [Solidesulfovibrio sp.]|uniref:CDP-glucose 4,6-dehydratase n=1 Tax=Solidesulfovibrio sp. TaxID=2910990 RepID=UPI0026266C72|nr:CDP-glucose 4,6-dehydratase [Solidesulfovibrio sp.]